MTFLELVQRVVQKANIADSGPPSVLNQFGDYQKAVIHVQEAHEEIQGLHFDWDFLWRHGSFTTQQGLDVYSPPDDLGVWDAQRVYLDGRELHVIEWSDYVPEVMSPAKPLEAVIRPDNSLQLIPSPDKAYTITFDYFRQPRVLVNNSDVPLIPKQFHLAIVGRALMLHGNYESAMDIKTQGAEMYQQFIQQLENHQLSRRQQRHGRMEGREINVVAV